MNTDPLTDTELTDLEKLCDAATDGPWEWKPGPLNVQLEGNIEYADGNPVLVAGGCHNNDGNGCQPDGIGGDVLRRCPIHPAKQDRDFIATARTALPRLIAEVRRLREGNTMSRDGGVRRSGRCERRGQGCTGCAGVPC